MTNRLFAYNPGGGGIIGVDILGELAMSNSERDYGADYAGLKWWGGPDEDLGYVIAKTIPPNDQPTEVPGLTGDVAFNRSTVKTEASFLDIVKIAFGQTFGTGDDAKTWLNNNGYWTSWGLGTPSATPTPTPTPAGPTSTPTPTPAPTDTPTPTPTPTPSARSGYYVASVLCDAVTGGTHLTNSYFYVGAGQGPMCDASSGGGDEITGLTAGTYYIYDVTNNKVREITTFGGSGTNFLLNGTCSTPSCGGGGGRTGYYIASVLCDAVTGGTQATGVIFGYSAGDTMCNQSVISLYTNEISGLSAGTYYIYDADNDKVRMFSAYGGSGYGSMSGTCSTPSCTGGGRTGYYYATTQGEATTGGTQLTNVNLYGSDFCIGMSGISADQFAYLTGPYYVYDSTTMSVRSISTYNSTLASFTGPCI